MLLEQLVQLQVVQPHLYARAHLCLSVVLLLVLRLQQQLLLELALVHYC